VIGQFSTINKTHLVVVWSLCRSLVPPYIWAIAAFRLWSRKELSPLIKYWKFPIKHSYIVPFLSPSLRAWRVITHIFLVKLPLRTLIYFRCFATLSDCPESHLHAMHILIHRRINYSCTAAWNKVPWLSSSNNMLRSLLETYTTIYQPLIRLALLLSYMLFCFLWCKLLAQWMPIPNKANAHAWN